MNDDTYSMDGEDDYAEVERELEADWREEAMEDMVSWFEANFEDPRNRTPWDPSEKRYVFVWGGPFDAASTLNDEFGERHRPEWIAEAVERIESKGVHDWAPTLKGAFFDDIGVEGACPDEDEPASRSDAAADILDRLERVEAAIADIRALRPFGHNRGPDKVGPSPLDERTEVEVRAAIALVRQELSSAAPSPASLASSESVLRRVGLAVAKWVGRKADLAIDEGIKQGMSAIKWKVVAGLMLGAAGGITHYLALPGG